MFISVTTSESFIQYFDHLSAAIAPELVSENVADVEMHTKGPLGNLWPETTTLLRGILRQSKTVQQGAYWVEGTANSPDRDYPVRFPLVRRTVRLERDQNANPVLCDPGPWQAHRLLGKLEPATSMDDPYADPQLRKITDAFVNGLDPEMYRVAVRAEYGLWHDDGGRDSVTLFPFASDRASAFDAIYGPGDDLLDHEDEHLEDGKPLRTPVTLNAEQTYAVEQARDRKVTVLSGPPGTGKTHALTAVLFEQLVAQRSTLIVTATEPAREAIETMLDSYQAVPVVRFGRDVSPIVLGNALAERASSLRVQGRRGELTKALDRAQDELAHYRSLAAALLSPQPPTSQTARRGDQPWWKRLLGGPWPAGADIDLPDDLDVDGVLDRLYQSDQQRRELAVDLFVAAYLGSVKPAHRRKLAELARALRLAPIARRDALAGLDAEGIAAAPIWLGTLDSVDTFLPPVASMFDLVIFDEASQVSQLDAAGALRRARRVLVIGDPHQMRHRALTTDSQREAAATIANLAEPDQAIADESRLSLYDVAAGVAPIIRLVDHYRSSPHIIAFSNEHFYAGELRLMTRHPWRESRDSIHLVDTRARVGPLARAQIDAAIRTAQTAQGHGYASVGVVVPDPENVAYATEVAKRILGPRDSSRPRLRIGEPRSFQGIELDVMIIVTGVGQGAGAPLALDRLAVYQDPNTLNTVITRARYDVFVVAGHRIEDLPAGLWRSYLESEAKPPCDSDRLVTQDAWKQLLGAETEAVGDVRVRPDYRVGPHVIDLVVGPGRLAFGVFTAVHRDGVEAHIERYVALRNLGWTLMHVLERDWIGRDAEAVIEIVRRARRV